jgi:hypothetical protein
MARGGDGANGVLADGVDSGKSNTFCILVTRDP